MAVPGETIATGAPTTCPDCDLELKIEVHSSAAGYYIGTWCHCGPYSRESGYYPTREAAEADLDTYIPRDSDFHPGPLEVIEL